MEEKGEYKAKWKKFDSNTIEAVLKKSNGCCWYCGKVLTIDSRFREVNSDMYVIEHFFPKIKGGGDDFKNLVPACWSCNSVKRTYDVDEFRELMTRADNNAPRFTDEQLIYFQRIGIELPRYEPHIFYFEKMGLIP